MGILNFLAPKKNLANSQAGMNSTPSAPAADNPLKEIVVKTMDIDSYLASDEMEWLRYLQSAIRTYRKPGVSLKDEHKLWLASRARIRPKKSVVDIPA
jgi:hypothetical protein